MVTIRVKRNGTQVTRLTAYDQTGLVAQSCTTSTVVDDDILELSITFDPASPICGMEQVGTVYNIQVHAIGPGLNQPYRFSCDTTSLAPTVISTGPLVVKGKLSVFAFYERRRFLQLEAVDTSGVPTNTFELGQAVQLRIVYDRGEKDPDGTWGYVFHTGFLKTTPGVDLSVKIYAEDLGTRVTITGKLGGSERNHMLYVPSEYPVTYTLPFDYQPSSTSTAWLTETKGLKIVALDHRIGVKVMSNTDLSSTITGAFIAASDSVLGTSYRLPTSFSPTASDAQALIIGVTDGTTLTLTYDDFTTTGITIDGTALSPGSDTSTLDENDSLHLVCGSTCKGLSVVASAPVAVVTGNGNDVAPGSGTQAGHMITQVPPTSQYGKRFVLLNVRGELSGTTSYQLLADTPVFTGTPHTYQATGGSFAFDDDSGNELELTASADSTLWSAEEIETDVPVVVTQFTTSDISGDRGPGMMVVPHVEQWGRTQTLPVRNQVTSDIVIVSAKGAMDTILVSAANGGPEKVTDFCFGHSDTFSVVVGSTTPSIRQDVTPISGVANYEFVFCQMIFPTEIQWIKFDGSTANQRLWVMAYEYDTYPQNSFNAFGLRYSNLNPCTPTSTQDVDTPIYPGLLLGDGKDNDCDGKVDEELLNGIDDDADGRIDEDLTVEKAVENLDPYAVRCTKLEMSSSSTFPAATSATLIDNGCVVGGPSEFPASSHFKAANSLIARYPAYWILQTDAFPVFRFRNTPSVYFRATVEFCDSGSGYCSDSCTGTRRRRSRKQDRKKSETVVLRLDINDTSIAKADLSATNSCVNDPIYWSLTTALLAVGIIEIVTILAFNELKQNTCNELHRASLN